MKRDERNNAKQSRVVEVDSRRFEGTRDRPVAGQWAQTGFKDFDNTVPRTMDSNWIRITHKRIANPTSPLYHRVSKPS